MERITVGELIEQLQPFDLRDRITVEVTDPDKGQLTEVILDRVENNPGDRCRVKLVCFDL